MQKVVIMLLNIIYINKYIYNINTLSYIKILIFYSQMFMCFYFIAIVEIHMHAICLAEYNFWENIINVNFFTDLYIWVVDIIGVNKIE